MADYDYSWGSYAQYSGTTYTGASYNNFPSGGTVSDGSADDTFNSNDPVSGPGGNWYFHGTIVQDGVEILVLGTFNNGNGSVSYVANPPDPNNFEVQPFDRSELNTDPFTVCFAEGTLIATPTGERTVESLEIGDEILDADGRTIAVKWLGKQTVVAAFGPAERMMPVRLRAGALGRNLPHTDLIVTADHALLVEGVLCQAAALVGLPGIERVALSEMGRTFTVYHVETEDHSLILANGAVAETFVDNISRRVFDNYAEYEALYGTVEEPMAQLTLPRALSPRQVPAQVRQALAGRDTAAA